MIVIVGGIIKKENQILMVKEAKKECYRQWNFPAGHLEEGETIFDGAIREIFEETGCKVKLTRMLPIISIKESNSIRITFLTELIEENIKFDTSEILEARWINIDDIEKMTPEELRIYKINRKILKNFQEGTSYPLDSIQEI